MQNPHGFGVKKIICSPLRKEDGGEREVEEMSPEMGRKVRLTAVPVMRRLRDQREGNRSLWTLLHHHSPKPFFISATFARLNIRGRHQYTQGHNRQSNTH